MALKHILGTVPVIRILDFLLDHRNTDYTRAEIAEHAGIGHTVMKRDFHCLIDCETVVETRRIGGVQLYKLNEDDEVTRALIDFYAILTIHWSEKIAEDDIQIVDDVRDADGFITGVEVV